MQLQLSAQQTQRLEKLIALSAEERMELRVQLAGRLGKAIGDLLHRSNDTPEKLYDQLVARIAEILTAMLQNKTLGIGVAERLSMIYVKKRSLQQKLFHAMPRVRDRYREFATDCLYDESELAGGFYLEGAPLKKLTTTRATLRSAVLTPHQVTSSIAFQEEQVRMRAQTKADTTSNMMMIDEATHARQIAAAHGPRIDNLADIYTQAVSPVTDVVKGEGVRIFHQFFRDLVVHERLSLLVAESMQRAFGDAVLRSQAREEDVRRALLNVLGEYVLAGMGIITQAQYKRQSPRKHALKEDVHTQWKLLATDGEEREIIDAWEADGGALYLPKWNTSGHIAKQIIITRRQSQAFLQQTVERDAVKLCDIIDMDKLTERAEQIVKAKGAKVVKRVMLEELLADTLEDERVAKALEQRIRGTWYDALHVFLERTAGEGQTN